MGLVNRSRFFSRTQRYEILLFFRRPSSVLTSSSFKLKLAFPKEELFVRQREEEEKNEKKKSKNQSSHATRGRRIFFFILTFSLFF